MALQAAQNTESTCVELGTKFLVVGYFSDLEDIGIYSGDLIVLRKECGGEIQVEFPGEVQRPYKWVAKDILDDAFKEICLLPR